MKFATKAIHAGQSPDPTTVAIMTPIFQTSTYTQAAPGDHKGYEYSRGTNPTRKALEDCLAALENGRFGLAFSSGMSATETVLKLLKPGDEVITGNDLRSEEHTSELQSLMRNSYAVYCLKKKKHYNTRISIN